MKVILKMGNLTEIQKVMKQCIATIKSGTKISENEQSV